MATPEPTISLGSNSVRIIICGMHPNFLQMKCVELPAKWSQPPLESTETEQMLLKQEQRSGFSVPAKMLSCPRSPGWSLSPACCQARTDLARSQEGS